MSLHAACNGNPFIGLQIIRVKKKEKNKKKSRNILTTFVKLPKTALDQSWMGGFSSSNEGGINWMHVKRKSAPAME